MHGSSFSIRFWGVRGSIPSPGADTALVGGNTSCVEVTAGDTRIVLDAGSGLRGLGDALMQSGDHRKVQLLLSHVHWDHVMGLPFFTPLYMDGVELDVACGPCGVPLDALLRRQMSAPMFPVELDSVGSSIRCRELADGERFRVGPIQIEVARLNHPDPVYAYRLEYGGRAMVYATDTEHGATVDQKLVSLARRADVLIYDAQYLPEEYTGEVGPSRRGWGHSTYAAGAEVARAAGVQTLALFHHDPKRTDDQVAEIVKRAQQLFPSTVAAREGLELELDAYDGSAHSDLPASA